MAAAGLLLACAAAPSPRASASQGSPTAPGKRVAGPDSVYSDYGGAMTQKGSISLRSPQPEAVLDSATLIALNLGGYTEARRAGALTLRIPHASFDSAFALVLRTGEVVRYAREAENGREGKRKKGDREPLMKRSGYAAIALEVSLAP